MAEATRQQKMDAVLAGTFDRLDPNARIQPGYTLNDIYSGILPIAKKTPTYETGMLGRGQPVRLPKLSDTSLGSERLVTPNPKLNTTGFLLSGMFGRGLPVVQPQQPIAVAGADPGLGGNMFGVEQTYFPPEQVPPPGIEPTKWAEASATPQTAVLSDLFTTDPTAGTTKAGYTYKNGQRVGKADWTAGQTPDEQYRLANAFAASNAKNATGTLKTGGVFENGVKVGNNRAPGISAAQAYDIVNQSARASAAASGKYATRGGSDVGSGVASSTNPWGI